MKKSPNLRFGRHYWGFGSSLWRSGPWLAGCRRRASLEALMCDQKLTWTFGVLDTFERGKLPGGETVVLLANVLVNRISL